MYVVFVVDVDSHLRRIVIATEETTVTQRVSHKPIKYQQSRLWSQRGTKVNGSHHGDSLLLKPTGIQIATKPMPGPTSREHQKRIGVKTISLGTNYSFYVLSGVLPAFQNLNYKIQRSLMSDVVIKNDTKFVALEGLHEDKLCDILQAMAPTTVKTVNQTSVFYIESNLDRLGLLSPTPGQRSRQQSGQIALQSGLINKPKFIKATHYEKKKIEIPR